MLSRFGGALHIGLSTHGVCILRTTGMWSKETKVIFEQKHDAIAVITPEQLQQICRAALANVKCASLPVTIVLDDDMSRMFLVTPPHNAGHLKDCQAAAAMRFQSLYGESSSDWQLEADWSVRHPFLACAVPKRLLAALQDLAIELNFFLAAIKPRFIAAWDTVSAGLPANAWLGLVHQGVLTLGAMDQRRLCAVRPTPIPADEHSSVWLRSHIVREALRLNLPMPNQLRLWGACPASWMDTSGGAVDEAVAISTLGGEGTALWEGQGASGVEILARWGIRT